MTKLAVGLTRTFAMVNIAYVNVRQKDDIRSTIIAQLAHGSCVEIGGVSSKDQNWFEVDFTLNGQKHDGYMYGPSLTFGKPDNMEKCEAFEYGK